MRRLRQRLGRHLHRRHLLAVVWVAWNYLSKVPPFSKVDDALGVVYTHGMAGFLGGLLLGIFGDPNMLEYRLRQARRSRPGRRPGGVPADRTDLRVARQLLTFGVQG